MSTILVIEDEEYMREVFADMLDTQGHRVTVAGTIEEGLDSFFNDPPDLLISDWTLPDGSGKAVADGIMARENRCSILYCTGQNTQIVIKSLGNRAGLRYDVLLKPFTIPELFSKINQFLN